MRTTMHTTYTQVLNNLNNLTSDIQDINNRISSTQQMSKPSDNPVHLVSALSLRSSLAEIKQYQENLIYGESMISAAESSLTQIKELIMRAKILTLQDINGSIVQTGRLSTAEEVHNLFEQAITLANTQINGKYIFGGYRTTGYDSAEPTPFIEDLVDGHRINGNNLTTMDTMLTGDVTSATISAGDLAINGIPTTADIDNGAGDINGLSMRKAANAKAEINMLDPTHVTATLTTLYAGAAATPDGGGGSTITFDLNGVSVGNIIILPGENANIVATKTVAAINSVKNQTGVEAVVGLGNNGGVANSVIMRNILAGDESTINIANKVVVGTADPGFNDFAIPQVADSTHNTGTISIQSDETFVLTEPNDGDDSILTRLGLDGGGKGFVDEALDGELIYGHSMTATDLDINGYSVGASVNDTISDIYADSSAEAKATAINAVSTNTAVTAVVIPVYRQATGAVEAGDMDTGDLVINGVDIFTSATTIEGQDSDNTFINAINAKTGENGIAAGRDSDGKLILSAQDGRNLHIKTSALGESISHLNSTATTGSPHAKVYFGQVQLKSERTFMLETTPTMGAKYEPGLAALGLEGGVLKTGEPNDTAGDGKLSVISIAKQDNNVRYAGDRVNNIEIKVAKINTLAIAKNGKETVADTGVFTVLKTLEDNLRNLNHTTVTGIHKAVDTTKTLDSGETGLANEDHFSSGTFTVTVTDHAIYPSRDFAMTISIDTSVDTLSGIAAKVNGVPGMRSWWDSDGYMHLETIDPDRYTYTVTDHTSNFLEVTGITQVDMQVQALDKSLSDLDQLMDDLTSKVADFGALANRIVIQRRIFDKMELSTSENLSEQQDTDLIEALMQLKNKETAYQAALAATARSLQISLVDFL